MEQTLVLLKPDCVQRGLIGRVLARFEDKGFNLVAMKLMRVTPDLAKRHYAEHVHKSWYPLLESFITAAPLVAAIVEGPEAIRVVRDMVGPTNGLDAPPGTVLEAADGRLVVAAGTGAVQMHGVQPAGKRMMDVEQFLLGYRVRPGDRFGPEP